MERLKAGRELSKVGGYGIDRKLDHMRSLPWVFWSIGGNSFVCVANGAHGLQLVSINGLGEVRWTVEAWNRDPESMAARAYFFEGAN